MGQNQLNRLQMVQFECPRVRNTLVCHPLLESSLSPFSAPTPSLLPLSLQYKELVYFGRPGKKVKISLTGCKLSSFNAPGSYTLYCPTAYQKNQETRGNRFSICRIDASLSQTDALCVSNYSTKTPRTTITDVRKQQRITFQLVLEFWRIGLERVK